MTLSLDGVSKSTDGKGAERGLEKGSEGGKGWAKGWEKGWDAEGWEAGVQKEFETSGKGVIKGWEKGPNGAGKGSEKCLEGCGKTGSEKGWQKGSDGKGGGREVGFDQHGNNYQLEWKEWDFGKGGSETGFERYWEEEIVVTKGKAWEKGWEGNVGKGTFWWVSDEPAAPDEHPACKQYVAPTKYEDVDASLSDFANAVEKDGKGYIEAKNVGMDDFGKKKWEKGSHNGTGNLKVTDPDGKEWKSEFDASTPEGEKAKAWENAWEGKSAEWEKKWEDCGENGWNWHRADKEAFW